VFHPGNRIHGISFVIILFLCGLVASWAMPQDLMNDKPDNAGKIEVGYAIVTPALNSPAGLVVFETYGEHRMGEMTQAGVLPSDMTQHCLMYVSSSGRLSKNLGVAITNPGGTGATVNLILRAEDGTPTAKKDISVSAASQTARFVTELFPEQNLVSRDFTGTLEIISKDIPIAVVGLRFRGRNFSTLPVTNLTFPTQVPANKAGTIGGPGSVILAHVATGGGWATEIVIVNTAATALTVRVDLFDATGKGLTATLNGITGSSFTNIKVPAMGTATLSPKDDN